MKLTEKDFAEYFPRSNRFLHFCAKYYGMSFHNDEVVEEASFQALKNVMRMYKRGQEFENEAEKTGLVMSCFRFGILNAYQQIDRRNRLDCRSESEVTYGYGEEEYSKYQANLISHDKGYDNLHSLLLEFVDNHLSRVERIVILENILGDKTYKMISNEHELSMTVLRSARRRALNKLRKYVSRITSTEHTKDQSLNNTEYISESRSKLRIETLLKSIAKEQEERGRYGKALSFVYLDE